MNLEHVQSLIVILIVVETSRQSDWDSIIACHRGLGEATTWNFQKGCMGKHRPKHERFNDYEKYRNTTCQVSTFTFNQRFNRCGILFVTVLLKCLLLDHLPNDM